MATISGRTRAAHRLGFLFGALAALALLNPLPALAGYASIVVDAETGKVLHEANPDKRNHPASLTKMMTLYMLFEAMDQGKVTLDTRLKVSKRAAAMAPSKMGLAPGSTIQVRDAIPALVIKSANDVAAVVAENLGGGSEAKFSQQMTTKAHAMGMRNTVFKNASGLPNKGQISSARDMAILAQRLMTDYPQHYHYFSAGSFTYAGQTINSHNRLMQSYAGADGLKTGYTAASGFNLATSAKRDNRRIIGVVLGGTSAKSRDMHMASLLDNGFARMNGQPETLIAAPMLYDSPVDTVGEEVAVGDIDEAVFPEAEIAAATKAKSKARKAELASSWGIQVGAYGSRQRATEQATAALSKMMTLYPGADVKVQATTDAQGRTLYRAQIIGLTQDQTGFACQVADVKTKAGCKAVAPLKPLKVASAKPKTTAR
jgi:D-alanyl-D-alanine carboxypeptidase